MTLCVCGCGQRADVFHHVVYQAELRRVAGRDRALADRLRGDERGMCPLASDCHERHHSRSRTLPLSVLPDAAFVFAAEVLGPARAFNYLGRVYSGADARLDALLSMTDEVAA